jgi:hypothetical protein
MIRPRIQSLVLVFSVFLSAASARACAVCGGDSNSDIVKGAMSGVVVMVAVTYGVLFCFAGMMVACVVRARRMARAGGQCEDGGDASAP